MTSPAWLPAHVQRLVRDQRTGVGRLVSTAQSLHPQAVVTRRVVITIEHLDVVRWLGEDELGALVLDRVLGVLKHFGHVVLDWRTQVARAVHL